MSIVLIRLLCQNMWQEKILSLIFEVKAESIFKCLKLKLYCSISITDCIFFKWHAFYYWKFSIQIIHSTNLFLFYYKYFII